MPRIRTIKPEFPHSESVGRLSRDARLLFIQLWTVADDDGRARSSSRLLASILYPFDDDARGLIDGWLDELEAEGCIRRYEVEATSYLDIPNWLKHQKIDHPAKSKIPEYVASPRETLAKPSRSLAPDLGPRTKERDQGKEEEEAVPSRKPRETSRSLAKEDAPSAPTMPTTISGAKRGPYAFEDGVIRLNARDLDRWRKDFPNLSLEAELHRLAGWPELKPNNWFHAVATALANLNREVLLKIERIKLEAKAAENKPSQHGIPGII